MLAVRPAQLHVQLVARDREQVRAEARFAPELGARLQAGQERLLDEIIGLALDLVLEEPIDLVEVPRTQHLAGRPIIGAPALEQREVIIHRRRA